MRTLGSSCSGGDHRVLASLYGKYSSALASITAPCLVLDLDAFKANIDWAIKNAGGKKIRLATKSLRSLPLIKKILSSSAVFQGVMCFDLNEALWLRDQGITDILMGYPTTDLEALKTLALNPDGIRLMVDLPEHLDLLERLSPERPFSVVLDLDLSTQLPFVRFGVYRSAIRGEDTRLESLINKLKACRYSTLVGLMGYEAQIAGLADRSSALMRWLKRRSIKELRVRRAAVVQRLIKEGFTLSLINGGGTGSLSSTRQEVCVTELTVGSGFYAPALFDGYQDFALVPAVFFALPIVRIPEKNIITCLGGGYIASGEIGQKKCPVTYLPQGLEYLKHEGAGEVQTPLRHHDDQKFSIGDKIFFRHAKAGEICERFNDIHLVENGAYQGAVKTYRGDGKSFL